MAEELIESAQMRPNARSRDRPAVLGPGQMIISTEDDERRRSEAALAGDLMIRVEVLSG